MAFVVLQNLHSAAPLMSSPLPEVVAMIKTLGSDQMALLLHHQAAEQNRNILYVWEQAQIVSRLGAGWLLVLRHAEADCSR